MPDNDSRNFLEWVDALGRGILIGASAGALAGYIGLIAVSRGVFLGGLVGILAGITIKNRRDSRKKRD
ncbi:hypothetical protein [Pseudodesulfovibrio tunisiensis]|uniref:hypothetical protein n=1 Tax=Pseudodesulfovibrio tunisiensis TaxID=463192 RepID=UPI001FB47F5A|nr:hypothetical protein [Pseudodesulfovibrio tunisiensis]